MLPVVRNSVRNNFLVRIIAAWNFLTDEIVSLYDVNIFKTKFMCIESVLGHNVPGQNVSI